MRSVFGYNHANASMKDVEVYLYDAAGHDEQIELEEASVETLGEKKLMWVNVLKPDEELLKKVTATLKLTGVPYKKMIDRELKPEIENFDDFFRFSVDSVVTEKGKSPEKQKIGFIVGKNFVVTVHEGVVGYFKDLREREKGETQFGEMDAESFTATLLDLNIVTYFKALNDLEHRVDEFDELVLKEDLEAEDFLKKVVGLRRDTSKLRRWLMPHREVYYALSRADFQQIAESDSAEEYKRLSLHFESVVDAVEHSRESVISIFELYATKSTHATNTLVQRLTFFTLMTGSLAVIAGILGMNFKAEIFEIENGFWYTVALLLSIAFGIAGFARYKGWI